jgi:hypothetical protein
MEYWWENIFKTSTGEENMGRTLGWISERYVFKIGGGWN